MYVWAVHAHTTDLIILISILNMVAIFVVHNYCNKESVL